MNLLYIANIRLPTERAHGIQIMKTCEAFVDVGIDVQLVVPTRHNLLTDSPFSYYRVAERFKLTRVSSPDWVRFGPLGFLISAVWFAEAVRLRKEFRTADFIYSRDALVLFQYLLLGKKFVFEAHSRPSFASRAVARRAYRLVVISRGLRDAYVQAGVRADRIIVAPDAADDRLFKDVPEKAEARKEVGLTSDKRIVMYAGHLYERKGASTLAAAAPLVPEVHFVFVGGAAPDVKAFKERWGNIENISIVGHVPHEKVPFYLRTADLLVLPNSGKDEDSSKFTSPMKLFEYLMSGTPIIASDVPALREILSDDTSLFVSPDDPKALAEGIHKALTDPSESRRRAERALSEAESYTWKRRADTILGALS